MCEQIKLYLCNEEGQRFFGKVPISCCAALNGAVPCGQRLRR
ncbi:MAG: hypothetical protein V8Q30_07530 [Acutalibacteraceae bacterium]